MKLPSAVLGLALAVFTGCKDDAGHDQAAQDNPAQGASLFEKNKGVVLPPEMRRDLGIETAPLTDRTLHRPVAKAAQVFRAGQAARPATAVLWLEAAEAQTLSPGGTLSVESPGTNSQATTALVVQLNRAVTTVSGQIEAVLEIADPAGRWPVGAFFMASLPTAATNPLPTVPVSAVIDGAQGPFVYTASGEHFVRTPVKVGASDGTHVEVTDGLYSGDVVVSRGAEALWTIELCALKGGTPCCPVPLKKGKP